MCFLLWRKWEELIKGSVFLFFLCCECKIDCMMIERERDEIVDRVLQFKCQELELIFIKSTEATRLSYSNVKHISSKLIRITAKTVNKFL